MRIRSAITRRRLVLVLCVLGLKSAAVFAGARVVTTGREARYADVHRAAVAALDAAVEMDAARWAPTIFFEAEGALRAAERAARLARTSILPDFSSAYAHLEQAVPAALRARDTAILVKAEAQAAAEDALALARAEASMAATLAATIDLGWRRRADAARSRLVLRQAELFYRDGEYEHTRVRAIEAHRLALDVIEVHGEGGRGEDWTRGCVALRNADIDALFPQVDVGTPVTIIGSDEPRTVVDLLPTAPSPLRQQRPRSARRAGRGARVSGGGGGAPRALKHDGEGQSEGAGVGALRVGIGGEP